MSVKTRLPWSIKFRVQRHAWHTNFFKDPKFSTELLLKFTKITTAYSGFLKRRRRTTTTTLTASATTSFICMTINTYSVAKAFVN